MSQKAITDKVLEKEDILEKNEEPHDVRSVEENNRSEEICIRDDEKNSALWKACREGRCDDVIQLLADGADPLQKEYGFSFYSSIHCATFGGNVDILRIILNIKGVNVNERDGWGCNPLMIACENDKMDAVKYLVENGATVDDVDNDGGTVLHWASMSRSVQMVNECLAWKGVNVNARNKKGRTALLCVCANLLSHSTSVVRRLLEANASLNEIDNYNRSAFYYAYRGSNWDTVDLLLQQAGLQFDVNSKDEEGRTVLYYASKEGSTSTVQLILQLQKTDIDIKDKYYQCAMDVAKTEEITEAFLMAKQERLWRMEHEGADDLYMLACRGLAIIINQRDFHMETDPAYKDVVLTKCLEHRNGTDVDCSQLKYTFEKFNCDTIIKENMTQMEMRRLISYLTSGNMDQVDSTKKLEKVKNYSCLVFCVLSHGQQGQVYGSNCVPLDIYKDIIYKFNSADCPSLNGKPKVFIIQACQGERTTLVFDDNSNRASSSSHSIPEITDFLVAFPTIPGYTALRDKYSGSPFIQTLCKYIEEYGDKEDIREILRLTTKELATKTFTTEDGETVTISSQYNCVLRNRLIFKNSSKISQDIVSNDNTLKNIESKYKGATNKTASKDGIFTAIPLKGTTSKHNKASKDKISTNTASKSRISEDNVSKDIRLKNTVSEYKVSKHKASDERSCSVV